MVTDMQNFSHLIIPLLISALIGYLLGSISFAVILTKAFTKEDVRSHGSGNAGATNVMRVAGKKASALTFLLDFLKCAASVVIGYRIMLYACGQYGVDDSMARLGMYAAGFLCIMGHMYPLYFGFRGGKGVVTTAAMMCMLDWRVFLICLFTFSASFIWKKTVSLSSIVAAITYPFATFAITYFLDYCSGGFDLSYVVMATLVALLCCVVVTVKHKENIKRILKGEEKPISFKKNK